MKHMRKLILAVLIAALLLTSGIAMAASASSCRVTADKLYLRASATSDSEALLSLREGTVLQITGKSGQWYKVAYGNYTGYVYSTYVELIEDGTLAKGSKGDAVKQLQKRLKELGYYSSSCDGNFGNVTVDALKAFEKKNGLTVDGIADAATLKKLNSSSAISAKGTTVSSKEEETTDSETLKKGSKGSAVKQLQQRLKQLGYYNNTIDGDYGSGTVTAVKAFQKKNGLTQTGTADKKTLDKIYSTSAISASDKVENADTSATLKKGSKGEEVKKLQRRLKELGYYSATVDGDYGSGTVTAVKAFQKKNGLTQNGTADETTLKKVYSDSAIGAKEETPAYTTLKSGSKGEAVKQLQRRLKELGYYSSTIDGDYGSGTKTAVKAFQKKNGLTQDGIADAATQKKLYNSSAISANDKEESADTSTTLKRGSKGEAVKELQRRLKELGYYKNSIDGDYGSGTVAAVKAFQKNNGLTQTGTADATTLKKMNSSSAIGATDKVESSDYTTLKSGSKGEAVKKLQQRLKELGYYTKVIDSEYGSGMVTAVKNFQKKNGLTQTGIADATTQKKAFSTSAIAANDKVATDDTTTDATLKRGSMGEAVKKLQRRLKELGYYNATVDGDYGSGTVTAVKAFQKKNGLTQTGTADVTTQNKLYSSTAIKADDKTDDDKDDIATDGTLKQGSSGSEVKKVQQRLKELGYYSSVCDGDYGAKTVTAVKAFQKKNGLTQTGICDAATLKKLNADNAVNANGNANNDPDVLNTNQTLQSGDNGTQVKLLQKRLKELGYYTTAIDNDYGYQTAAAVSAFQRANGLTVNGTANSTTLKKLMSSSAVSKAEADKKEEASKTYKTEKLDWFNGGRAKLPKGVTIQIKDVKTGLVFKGRVLYGTNHLDVEPLTKADTATLLKINGGVSFKDDRRAMLVKYNDHVYAASIYSVPHGEQTITTNNFDGQFCLHFYGSKTHGTDKVDSDHQSCVAQAMKATW